MIYRWKHPTLKCHAIGFIQGFAELADGLVTVCSLGFYGSGFEMLIARYRAKQFHQLQKLKELNHD
jgi:hypothetical protein